MKLYPLPRAGAKPGQPAAPAAARPDPGDPPPCPCCGGERLVYSEPGVPDTLVCIDCDRWGVTPGHSW